MTERKQYEIDVAGLNLDTCGKYLEVSGYGDCDYSGAVMSNAMTLEHWRKLQNFVNDQVNELSKAEKAKTIADLKAAQAKALGFIRGEE